MIFTTLIKKKNCHPICVKTNCFYKILKKKKLSSIRKKKVLFNFIRREFHKLNLIFTISSSILLKRVPNFILRFAKKTNLLGDVVIIFRKKSLKKNLRKKTQWDFIQILHSLLFEYSFITKTFFVYII